ncbi:MAG: hypothetical protein ABL866_13280 [Devosia sp.]
MPASSLPAPLAVPPSPLSPFAEYLRRRRARVRAPLISRRDRDRLAPCIEELDALLRILHALPRHLPLPPDLRRRARNAVSAVDRVIARLPVEPEPPVKGDSNVDFGVGLIARLALLSRFARYAFRIDIERNLAAQSGSYRIYPRGPGEE